MNRTIDRRGVTAALLALAASCCTSSEVLGQSRVVAKEATSVAAPEGGLAAWTVRFELDSMPGQTRRPAPGGDGPLVPDLALDVGQGGPLPAVIDRVLAHPGLGHGAGGVAWSGRVLDGSQSTFLLAQVDGALAGALWHSEFGNFNILPAPEVDSTGRRLSIVVHLDPEAPMRCGTGQLIKHEALDAEPGRDRARLARLRPIALEGARPGAPSDQMLEGSIAGRTARAPSCTCTDDGSRVDVLIVYTPQAAAQVGGIGGIEAVALASVESMNVAMVNSAVVDVELHLVAVEATSYAETLPGVSGEEVFALQRKDDGILDDVHPLRAEHRADLVAMLRSNTGIVNLGIAFINAGAVEYGFSITAVANAVGPLVFAHELGHNFSLMHDRANAGAAFCHHAFGNRFTAEGTQRRTIMAYAPGQLVPHFSNPDVDFLGVPTGVALGTGLPCHNTLGIERASLAVANNLSSGETIEDCNGNGIPDCEDIASGFSQDLNGNGVPDECELRLHVDASAPDGGDGLSWSTAFNRLSDAIGEPIFRCGDVLEVWVAAGLYTPTRDGLDAGRHDAFWIGPHTRLLGGFSGDETSADQRDPAKNLTILSGDRLGDDAPNFTNRADNSFRVVSVTSGTDGSALIDGFTIRGGHANQAFNGGNNFGSGIKGWAGSPRIHNCILTDNFAHWGGAIAVGNAEIEVVNCLITGNRSAPPGAGNGYGAGLAIHNEMTARVVNSTIVGNESVGPASLGGGVHVTAGSTLDLSNSILWANEATLGSQIALRFEYSPAVGERPSQATITHSAVMNGEGGVYTQAGQHALQWSSTNVSDDPTFFDAKNGDFRLAAGSPCIDAGNDGAVPDGVFRDLAQNPRFVDANGDALATVDIGAYELQTADCPIGDLNCDGVVDAVDLGQLLVSWGACDGCAADLDGDGVVDGADLGILLNSWG